MNRHRHPGTSRRRFLAGTLACAALPRLVSAQGAGATPVNDRMTRISGVGGNVLAVSTGDGLLLVDTGAEAATTALLDTLAALEGGDSVHTVFNTHWHRDQVGGNEVFGSRGAQIIAHKNTLDYLSVPYYLFGEDSYMPPLPAAAHPDVTFYEGGETSPGDESVEYGYLEMAHTNGDIYVRFPQANVIAVGDVVSPEIDPGFDWFSGGWIGGRVDALNLLLDMIDGDTQVVPAYGPVVGRAHVEAERDMMQFMYDTLVDQIRMGFDYEDSLASGIMDNLPRTLDDPAKFLYDAHKGLWAHHNKLEPNIV